MSATGKPLLSVENATKTFDLSVSLLGRIVGRLPRVTLHAVDGVSFEIKRGTTFGLVGRKRLRQVHAGAHGGGGSCPRHPGKLLYDAKRITAPGGGRGIGRGTLQMVFQDPYASVNPRWRVCRYCFGTHETGLEIGAGTLRLRTC